MKESMALVGAFGLGAGLTYFLDPAVGRRRRTRLRDRARGAIARGEDLLSKTERDLSQRARGIMAEASHRMRGSKPASDQVIANRVRARIGRVCSHASAVMVDVQDGQVTLRGQVLADEVDDIVRAARATDGVQGVENHMERHAEAGRLSSLQGGGRRPANRIAMMRPHWSPTTRVAAGAVGTALMANCLARRTLTAALFGTAGFFLFLRSATNIPLMRLVGLGESPDGFHFIKTVNIKAPPDEVFGYFRDFTNFPQFMRHVRDVRDLGDGRYRWTVEGPAGVAVHWDTMITELIPNRMISWQSTPGAPVSHMGVAQFRPNQDGGTRVQIRMSYVPPAGVFGHVVAALFGADPKHEMDDDLMRMKTFIETGKQPHDAAASRKSNGRSASNGNLAMNRPRPQEQGAGI